MSMFAALILFSLKKGNVSETSHIPKRSSDFGPEPRGYSNDYYDDKE